MKASGSHNQAFKQCLETPPKHALVLMTALLPTTGHRDLIAFAAGLPETRVCVLVNGRSFEPLALEDRLEALREEFKDFPQVEVRGSLQDEAPQVPEDLPGKFWQWWQEEAGRAFPEVLGKWDYVVASEPYGQVLAEHLGAVFMPFDLARRMNAIKSTSLREDPWKHWEALLPRLRRKYLFKAVLFGQESVGKTTLMKRVSARLGVLGLEEWARPFQEVTGCGVTGVTAEAMEAITSGQAALQAWAFREARTPAVILDTDLYSTVGYYKICLGEEATPAVEACEALAWHHRGSHYYLLPEDVPFEADPLRYGGDHRESPLSAWEDLLKAKGLSYSLVPEGSLEAKVDFIASHVQESFLRQFQDLASFKRT